MHKAFNNSSPFGKLYADKLTILDEIHVNSTKKQQKNFYLRRVLTKLAQKSPLYFISNEKFEMKF